jgi:hypothetical protein
MRRDQRDPDFEPDHDGWLEERVDPRETATGADRPSPRPVEPLYEQTRQTHLHEGRRQR